MRTACPSRPSTTAASRSTPRERQAPGGQRRVGPEAGYDARMLRGSRAALVGLCAVLLGASVAGTAEAVSDPTDLYWLGPYFGGMWMTATPEDTRFPTYVYGD